ncbi:MAG TPA: HD domain-containing protein [Puia sp.]|nr:HD domain-containing protein [Puia sp.]
MDYINLEKNAEAFVRKSFANSVDHQYPYHNLAHTVNVVEHVVEIGNFYEMRGENLAVIKVAGWFHDIGHLYGAYEGHEERGVVVMKGYMEQFKAPKEMIGRISECIIATKFPSHPGSLYEKILCDSDTYHFGTEYFRQTDVLVHQEMELRTGCAYPDWHKKSIWLLEHHQFFTPYCQELLEKGKQENLKWLRSLTD